MPTPRQILIFSIVLGIVSIALIVWGYTGDLKLRHTSAGYVIED